MGQLAVAVVGRSGAVPAPDMGLVVVGTAAGTLLASCCAVPWCAVPSAVPAINAKMLQLTPSTPNIGKAMRQNPIYSSSSQVAASLYNYFQTIN